MVTLTDDEVEAELLRLPGWSLDDAVPRSIARVFRFEGFPEAIAFVNRVAELAERADHHPDLDVRFSAVGVRLSTHSAGGVTRRDLSLASEIEAVA